VRGQIVIKISQRMANDPTVPVIVNELNPGVRVVGLTRDKAKGKSEPEFRRGKELDFSRGMAKPSLQKKTVELVQEIEGIEEEIVMATATGGLLDQNTVGIFGIDSHPAKRSFNQGTPFQKRSP
jgi:hypothetical protein